MSGWSVELPPDERRRIAREIAVAARREQGLPDEIEDAAVIERLTALAFASDAQPGRATNSPSPARTTVAITRPHARSTRDRRERT